MRKLENQLAHKFVLYIRKEFSLMIYVPNISVNTLLHSMKKLIQDASKEDGCIRFTLLPHCDAARNWCNANYACDSDQTIFEFVYPLRPSGKIVSSEINFYQLSAEHAANFLDENSIFAPDLKKGVTRINISAYSNPHCGIFGIIDSLHCSHTTIDPHAAPYLSIIISVASTHSDHDFQYVTRAADFAANAFLHSNIGDCLQIVYPANLGKNSH